MLSKLSLGLGAILTAALFSAHLPAAAQEFKLRFATSVANTQEASFKEMEAFAQRVKERCKGRIELQLFPAEQLGAQKKVNEMISSGANIMNMTDYGQMGQFVPDAGVLAGNTWMRSSTSGCWHSSSRPCAFSPCSTPWMPISR